MTTKAPPVKNLKCIDENGIEGESYSLDKKYWVEHVRTQRENAGSPFTVPASRVLTIRFAPGSEGNQVRVYEQVII